MIQQLNLQVLCFTFIVCYAAAQTSSAREDDSLDSATMAILVLVVVSALLFIGSFSLWIQRCCHSPISYARSESFRSVMFAGARSRVRGRGDNDLAEESVRGVDTAVIESFPTFVYSAVKELKIGVGSLECAVCLNEFSGEELLKLLPSCEHVFHPHCIGVWLANHTTCPVCRARVVGKFGSPIKRETSIALATAIYPEDFTSVDADGGMTCSASDESVIDLAGDGDRFTLRLPDGLRDEIEKVGTKVNRSASCEHLPGVSRGKRGLSDGGDGSGSKVSRWLGRSERWGSSVAPSDCFGDKEDGSNQLPV